MWVGAEARRARATLWKLAVGRFVDEPVVVYAELSIGCATVPITSCRSTVTTGNTVSGAIGLIVADVNFRFCTISSHYVWRSSHNVSSGHQIVDNFVNLYIGAKKRM